MFTIGEPRGVDLGGVQNITARVNVRFKDLFRGGIIDCGTEPSGAKAEHRRSEVRAWNAAGFHWRFRDLTDKLSRGSLKDSGEKSIGLAEKLHFQSWLIKSFKHIVQSSIWLTTYVKTHGITAGTSATPIFFGMRRGWGR
jgi:hypothetical protein